MSVNVVTKNQTAHPTYSRSAVHRSTLHINEVNKGGVLLSNETGKLVLLNLCHLLGKLS